MTQTALVPHPTPADLIREADDRYGPFVARYALVSGGRDSSVLAHRCREHYDALVFINTGTALPGTVEHVEQVAEWVGAPLIVKHTPTEEYDRLVLGSDTPRSNGKPNVGAGFPGPALHGTCYTRLKERAQEELLREAKAGHPRSARILLLTGVRRSESARRRKRPTITKKGGRVFVNPLSYWADLDVREYAELTGAPISEASALLHRSGECNCGAFAAAGEREMLRALYPEWFAARIAPLEASATAAGFGPRAVWGHGISDGPATAGELCQACPLF